MQRMFLFLLVIFCVGAAAMAQDTAVPRFEEGTCAVKVPQGENVRCGYLIARENRSSRSLRTIKLPIIIMKSDAASPLPDPVLRTLGGPGGSSLRMVTGRRFSPWLRQRDMIIFEQRGTKYAQPALECPEVDRANIDAVVRRLPAARARRAETTAARQCFQRLSRQGIDLSSFNSAESAADIEDLRRVLGIGQLNLYGVSYSARLMLEVAKAYPASVRSIVLESTMPPEINYDETGVDNIARSFDLFFSRCRSDANCSTAYPTLEKDFYAMAAKLDRTPAEVNTTADGRDLTIRLSGDDVMTWLADYVLSSDGRAIVAAPAQIVQMLAGNYEDLRDYAQSRVSPGFYSWGMRYSVWCSEEMPFESMSKIAAQSAKYDRFKGYETQSLPRICKVWNVKHRTAAANQPVSGKIPMLVLAGEFDAYTPPAWGAATARRFENSFYFEVPWAGHGPGFNSPSCLADMVAAFLTDPTVRPDDGCLGKIQKYFKFPTKTE